MLQNKKNIIIFLIIAIFIIGFSTWFIYRDIINKPISSEENNAEQKNNSIPNPPQNIEEIKKQMPNLDRDIVVTEEMSEKEKNIAIENIKELIALLKKNYDNREDWLNLGIWFKNIGDYKGAEEAWKFVAFIRPEDAVPFNNLGDLYAQNLKDFPSAEKYYLIAIEKSPKTTFYYIKLHEFYRYYTKDQVLAEDILVKAVNATNDQSVKDILNSYREEIKKK